jgi:hypothetical protein
MVSFIVASYFILGITAASEHHKNYCPVSSRQNVSLDGYLPYPSIYWPNSSQPIKNEETYNCTIRPVNTYQYVGKCFPKRSCMITSEEVLAALQVQKWEARMDGICNLGKFHRSHGRKSKSSPSSTSSSEVVNVIVIGGSMTAGTGSSGHCFCTHSEDSRCPDFERKELSRFCSWPTQFMQWMDQEFPQIHFNFHDLSGSGLNSGIAPAYIEPFFLQINFTKNDIILIDESVNDHGKPLDVNTKAVEQLIRRIYSFTRGIIPTIIFIEQFAHRDLLDSQNTRPFEKRISPGDYTIAYRTLSERCHFVYYSLREMYWNNLDPRTPIDKRYPFSPFNYLHTVVHPPWYVSKFMADIIADCFLYSLSRCSKTQANGTELELPSPSDHDQDLAANGDNNDDDYCDPNSHYLLDAHASNYFTPKNLLEFEEGPEAHKFGWREYVDYHNVSGWMINSLSDPKQRTLSFPLSEESYDLNSHNSSEKHILIVVIYLRSYVGMGIASLEVCGIPFESLIDGLFPNYQSNHVSIPQVATFRLTQSQIKACQSLPKKDRSVSFVYQPEVRTKLDHIRNQKKLKILSIDICLRAK